MEDSYSCLVIGSLSKFYLLWAAYWQLVTAHAATGAFYLIYFSLHVNGGYDQGIVLYAILLNFV